MTIPPLRAPSPYAASPDDRNPSIATPEEFCDYLASMECNREAFARLREATNNWTARPPITSKQLDDLFLDYIQEHRYARAEEFVQWPEFSTLSNDILIGLHNVARQAWLDLPQGELGTAASRLHDKFIAACKARNIVFK